MKYTFLVTSLPPLYFGDKAPLSFEEFFRICGENLTEEDLKKLGILRMWIDIRNIRHLLGGDHLLPHGNLDEKELRKAIEEKEYFPRWVIDFLDEHSEKKERLAFFPALLMKAYQEWGVYKGFWGRYMNFERDLALILAGYRAKRLKVDLGEMLSFEEKDHPIVQFLLASKEAPHFEAPFGYEDANGALSAAADDPKKQQRLVAAFRFRRVKELVENELFSLDWIMGYGVLLSLLEEQERLATARGDEIIERILA